MVYSIHCAILFQHNVKKLRNNISKSKDGGTRNLTVGQLPITWKQWIDAFNWDQTSLLPLHHRLTPKHFELGYASDEEPPCRTSARHRHAESDEGMQIALILISPLVTNFKHFQTQIEGY